MLVGLIWVIQVLVYPQFLRVRPADFVPYHVAHCWRMVLIITPLVLAETGAAAWLLYEGHRETPFIISVGLIPVIWLITALFQAPAHLRLMRGYQEGLIQRLLMTNWLRTFAWTARGVLLISLVVR